MKNALRAMGVTVEQPDATTFIVEGPEHLRAPAGPLFLGNAGTATRFLTAAAVLADGPVTLTGDEHMRKRPIAPLVAALRGLGVTIDAPTGCPPVTIQGQGGFEGGQVFVDAQLSSQYVSALLMLAPKARMPVRVTLESSAIGARGYIDLTCAVMRRFGAQVEQIDASNWVVYPGQYVATDFPVEPDASASTYLWAAEVLTGGCIDIDADPNTSIQPDARAYELIQRFPQLPVTIDGSQIQDAVPTLAVLAAFNDHPVRFINIANLRVKECDRIAAMATELSRLSPGLAAEDGDELVVTPVPVETMAACQITTYSDHRIAMSLALAGLRVNGVTIRDPDCVGKTYPGYWRDLASLGIQFR